MATDHIKATRDLADSTFTATLSGTMLTFADKTSVTLVGVTNTDLGALLG